MVGYDQTAWNHGNRNSDSEVSNEVCQDLVVVRTSVSNVIVDSVGCKDKARCVKETLDKNGKIVPQWLNHVVSFLRRHNGRMRD